MNNLKIYVPSIYDGVEEFDNIMDTEQNLLQTAEDALITAEHNQFVVTSEPSGVAQFEKQLGIIPNPAIEDIEFRKERIINRLSTKPPYTFNYLKQKLNELIGVGKYNTWLDTNNYTLYIESSARNQIWAQEIAVTLNAIKPANIVFISKPFISEDIEISEQISYNQIEEYNYKLGTTWILGAKPFVSQEYKGVIKLAETASIQSTFLNKLTVEANSMVAKVLINDSYPITEFETKQATNNIVTLEYIVPEVSGLQAITNVKLLDASDNVLTSVVVYVPLVSDAVMKHIITIKEGV